MGTRDENCFMGCWWAFDEPLNCLNLLPNQMKIIMFHAFLDKWMALEFPLMSFLRHAESLSQLIGHPNLWLYLC